jgi:hypothetical protein
MDRLNPSLTGTCLWWQPHPSHQEPMWASCILHLPWYFLSSYFCCWDGRTHIRFRLNSTHIYICGVTSGAKRVRGADRATSTACCPRPRPRRAAGSTFLTLNPTPLALNPPPLALKPTPLALNPPPLAMNPPPLFLNSGGGRDSGDAVQKARHAAAGGHTASAAAAFRE